MSTLGEILAHLHDPEEVYELLVEAGDLGLMAKLNEAAARSAVDPCDLALEAVRSFTDSADEEAWVKLMGRLRDEDSPGAACLSEMISWSLAR